MTTVRSRPWYHLTRHFFHGLFDLGFLSEVGADSFTRTIVGCGAVCLAVGLLLLRLYMVKYAMLAGLDGAEPYRRALIADQAFLLALPMWVVACATVLVGHSLFPDAIDFRVLMALPVSRRLVFGAKLLALAAFTGLFTVAVHAVLLPLWLLMSAGRWAAPALPLRLAAHACAGLLASGFAVLAVTTVHGLAILAVPRGRLLAISATLRSVMLGMLVVSLPMVLRLPAQADAFANGSFWLYLAPPAWFLGLERWLSPGEAPAQVVRLAHLSLLVMTLVTAFAAGSYLVLYRRFDRVVSAPAQGCARSARRLTWRRERPVRRRPVFDATRVFTRITLRRSVLHQGILVALSAAGAGLVVNSLIAGDVPGWLAGGGKPGVGVMASVIWAPFALIYVVSLAIRLALAVPIEPRANWIFRITEQPSARADQLEAAVHAVRRLGTIVPLALLAPLEWLVLGRGAIGVVAVAWICGWLLAEILMKNWALIPFTCSYIPGKGFVPQTVLTGLLSFVVFTTLGGGLARVSLTGHPASFAFDAVLVAGGLALRGYRLHKWKDTPLTFEDQLPSDVTPLRLQD